MLELLVHIDRDDAPDDLVLGIADVPDRSIEDLDRSALPENWRAEPPPAGLRAIGDDWVRLNSSIGLRVRSVLSPTEANLLINPRHPRVATSPTRRLNGLFWIHGLSGRAIACRRRADSPCSRRQREQRIKADERRRRE